MLYYLHGYQSSPTGEKATLLKETLHVHPISYREGPPEDLVISQCLDRISEAIQNDPHVVLIGSSLGGFLAASTALTHRFVQKLILLNPAIIPPEIDLRTIEGLPPRILKEITILRGTHDDVVPDLWILRFAQAQNATIQLYNDDHRFSKNLQKLPGIIADLI
jgi:pimeloyl-ACP methyl ester carboxylesterase